MSDDKRAFLVTNHIFKYMALKKYNLFNYKIGDNFGSYSNYFSENSSVQVTAEATTASNLFSKNEAKINKAFGVKLNESEQNELDKNTQNKINNLSLKR